MGIIGAGRIGAAYARMLAEGHKMDIVYFDPYPNKKLEEFIGEYGALLKSKGERAVTIEKLETVEDVLKRADVRGPPHPTASLRTPCHHLAAQPCPSPGCRGRRGPSKGRWGHIRQPLAQQACASHACRGPPHV